MLHWQERGWLGTYKLAKSTTNEQERAIQLHRVVTQKEENKIQPCQWMNHPLSKKKLLSLE